MDFYTEYFTMLNALATSEKELQDKGRFNLEPATSNKDIDVIINNKKKKRIHIKDAVIRKSFHGQQQDISGDNENETEDKSRSSHSDETSSNSTPFQSKNNQKNFKEHNGELIITDSDDELETYHI